MIVVSLYIFIYTKEYEHIRVFSKFKSRYLWGNLAAMVAVVFVCASG